LNCRAGTYLDDNSEIIGWQAIAEDTLNKQADDLEMDEDLESF